MEIIGILLLAAFVFGICFLVDKCFIRLFRSTAQHSSGRSVRLSKRYVTAGVLVFLLGLSGIFAGISSSPLVLIGGCILVAMGIGLIFYYVTFGVYYTDETFLSASFGKKSRVYRYEDIRGQQLYTGHNALVVELYLTDGKTVQLSSAMDGVFAFLDFAAHRYMEQTGQDGVSYFRPDASCWFPQVEG